MKEEDGIKWVNKIHEAIKGDFDYVELPGYQCACGIDIAEEDMPCEKCGKLDNYGFEFWGNSESKWMVGGKCYYDYAKQQLLWDLEAEPFQHDYPITLTDYEDEDHTPLDTVKWEIQYKVKGVPMKRFWLFGGYHDSPNIGMHCFWEDFNTKEEAIKYYEDNLPKGHRVRNNMWGQVFDTLTRTIVYRGNYWDVDEREIF